MTITILLIVHGLLAVALLGAITHQALAVATKSGGAGQSFSARFRSVDSTAYVPAICLLTVATALLGGLIYPQYRIDVRPTLEDLDLRAANGVFEIKEHLVAIALGVLPAYWIAWRTADTAHAPVRRYLTWLLAVIVWFSFLVGHILNNVKGLMA